MEVTWQSMLAVTRKVVDINHNLSKLQAHIDDIDKRIQNESKKFEFIENELFLYRNVISHIFVRNGLEKERKMSNINLLFPNKKLFDKRKTLKEKFGFNFENRSKDQKIREKGRSRNDKSEKYNFAFDGSWIYKPIDVPYDTGGKDVVSSSKSIIGENINFYKNTSLENKLLEKKRKFELLVKRNQKRPVTKLNSLDVLTFEKVASQAEEQTTKSPRKLKLTTIKSLRKMVSIAPMRTILNYPMTKFFKKG